MKHDSPLKITTGIYVINKPKGWTSFDIVNKLKKISGIKKIGHAGTLDPLATGVLVVAVGREYTKQIDSIVNGDKVYLAEVLFGIETDSYDIDGIIKKIKQPIQLTEEAVIKSLPKFRGNIQQKPPIFSAIKVKGKRLYQYARQNKPVEIQFREVNVLEYELKKFSPGKYPKASFYLKVSKGTYVRSLLHDLGQSLGSSAIMTDLIRLKVGDYSIEKAHEINQFY